MNLKELYRSVSSTLMNDFNKAGQYKHSGNTGNYREDALNEFLKPRMPLKYGIGNGEIIGFQSESSKQSDLIIYDKEGSVPLDVSSTVQAYPVGSIYGVIEVKSQLSKPKLLEGLENIKSVKSLVPNDSVTKSFGWAIHTYPRPKPFGCIFAYKLDGNSLNSLVKNLREWESENAPEHWPNMVVVLNEGIIAHHPMNGKPKWDSVENTDEPYLVKYGEDTLFQFYSNLLDIANNMNLPILELSKYRYPTLQYKSYPVEGADLFYKKDDSEYVTIPLTESLIADVVTVSISKAKLSRGGLLNDFGLRLDATPFIDEKKEFFLYDPEGKFLNKENLSKIINSNAWYESYCEILVNTHPVYIPIICLNSLEGSKS